MHWHAKKNESTRIDQSGCAESGRCIRVITCSCAVRRTGRLPRPRYSPPAGRGSVGEGSRASALSGRGEPSTNRALTSVRYSAGKHRADATYRQHRCGCTNGARSCVKPRLARIILSAMHTCTSANHRHVRSPSTMRARSANMPCAAGQLQPVSRSNGFG